MPAPKFEPKVIFITGCSSGFGLRTAVRLAKSGHHVIATMRDLNRSGTLTDEIRNANKHVDLFKMDVTDKRIIKEVVRAVAAKYGYIDVLINNAGFGLGGFFEDLADEEIRNQMETNFFGVQNVTREVIPCMRQRRSGKIINISSIAGLSASPSFSAYNASKWALEGFSESLRYEMKIWGIDVVLIEPGTYKTKIFYENARYGKNFTNADSPYFTISSFLAKKVKTYVDGCDKNLEDIPKLIEKIINSKKPPFRNIPDIETRILYGLRKILPFRLYSFLIYKTLFSGFQLPK
ncbi:MAG: SDR family oxidoreductase [Candidatus Omnitrophica bacterium]|nr:SDR family oxidoreductase [Candidatus Omnitrophota bacterium]